MGLIQSSSPRMQSAQPRVVHKPANILAPEHERQDTQIIQEQDSAKDPRNNNSITVRQNPIEKVQAHSKRDSLFAQIHSDEHLGRIGMV